MFYLIPDDVTILCVYIQKECNAIGVNKEVYYYHNSISKKAWIYYLSETSFLTDCE